MLQHVVNLLKKIKSLVFDQYILLILVPLGFILQFIITAPFMVLCALENITRKNNPPRIRPRK